MAWQHDRAIFYIFLSQSTLQIWIIYDSRLFDALFMMKITDVVKTGTPRMKILVLAGPTAVGKTRLAIEWAIRFNGEIIGTDSRQIYRHMDIGTAKPTPEEQAAVRHYMIDVVNPDETFTLAEYQAQAYALIHEIHKRGKLPMLVGGTGLYITAVMEGWTIPEVPPNPGLRAELEQKSPEALFSQLETLDPITAASIDRNNPRRLVRALEVTLSAGRPFSELRQKNVPDYDAAYFALTMDRAALYAQADSRVEKMLAAGWIEETRQLQARGYAPPLPAMSALGYPQIFAHLRGEISLDETRQQIQLATHKFIRRQYTWLRGHDPGWQWITPGQEVSPQVVDWLARG